MPIIYTAMERKYLLITLFLLTIFLIGTVFLVEDRFIDVVNMLIPDGTVVSVYIESSSNF